MNLNKSATMKASKSDLNFLILANPLYSAKEKIIFTAIGITFLYIGF